MAYVFICIFLKKYGFIMYMNISMNPDELEEHLKDKDKIRDEYDAQTAVEGTEYEDKEDGVLKKKRRVDTNSVAAKRYKDFKF
jgi:hypothetical protein